MCVLCGDPYSLEAILSPLLSSPWCVPAGDRTIQIHTFLGETMSVMLSNVKTTKPLLMNVASYVTCQLLTGLYFFIVGIDY